MVLTLYKLDGSPPACAVLMTIEALGIRDVNYVDIDIAAGDHLKEDFIKMNPQHTVPLLKDDDFLIWDSHAITAYLVGKYAKDDSLYPKDLKKRAIVDQRLHFDSGILFPAIRGTLEPIAFGGEKELRPENIEKVKKGYDVAEKLLTSPWLAGDQMTLADICCVATISASNVFIPIDAGVYPKLTAWLKRCSQLEFFKNRNVPGLEAIREGIMSHMT